MKTQASRVALVLALVVLGMAGTASAETRLFVPQFSYGPQEDTQFLLINGNDRDAIVDLWAFTSRGELLGQFQMAVRSRSTRSLTLSEAFQPSEPVTGWLGVVSNDEGIELSYSLLGQRDGRATTESYDAVEWTSKAFQRSLEDPKVQMVQISNPNAFPAQVTLKGLDSAGRFVATRDVTVAPFAQLEAGVGELLGESAVQLSLLANADVVTTVSRRSPAPMVMARRNPGERVGSEQLALVVETAQSLGAYQVTLRFDPRAVQFTPQDVQGGLAEGFESRPLVVNIDNVAGEMTLGSFQVGTNSTGRIAVARIKVSKKTNAASRFRIHVDEVTNDVGTSLTASDVTVGLVRAR